MCCRRSRTSLEKQETLDECDQIQMFHDITIKVKKKKSYI